MSSNGLGASGGYYPRAIAAVNDLLFFRASDELGGGELWRSDGTAVGTFRVKDVRPGPESSALGWFTNLNGTLFFTADDGETGFELWKSDGTEAGTVRVKDIQAGATGSVPEYLIKIQGTLYFSAADGVHGRTLWSSNGTESTTQIVEQARMLQSPRLIVGANDFIFLSAVGDNVGDEVWVLDNSPALVGDLNDDGVVDTRDAEILFAHWSQPENADTHGSQIGDLNGDGYVDSADAGVLFSTFTPQKTTQKLKKANSVVGRSLL